MIALRTASTKVVGGRLARGFCNPSVQYGLKHLRGESRHPRPMSPLPGMTVGLLFCFGACFGGWAAANPEDAQQKLAAGQEAITTSVRGVLPEILGGSKIDANSEE
eukprot:CAMPEP_0185192314 /NCGR_PEP_ID=MMETSP1140-20130426/17880_1 /TAXON_ID=298111 /ORGANISM="Pavlova sp., Strain CCMP459" /LENGTH=105 /DNA_ID=CAMNT_0027759055 /DNA_START=73 /DNA_END=390 /DNA_ORIENTATION=+